MSIDYKGLEKCKRGLASWKITFITIIWLFSIELGIWVGPKGSEWADSNFLRARLKNYWPE